MTSRQGRQVTGIIVAATLLWGGPAVAKFTPDAQQNCDYARIRVWRAYQACVDAVVALDARGNTFDREAAFAKCRHAYFKVWPAIQGKAKYAGSTCDCASHRRALHEQWDHRDGQPERAGVGEEDQRQHRARQG